VSFPSYSTRNDPSCYDLWDSRWPGFSVLYGSVLSPIKTAPGEAIEETLFRRRLALAQLPKSPELLPNMTIESNDPDL